MKCRAIRAIILAATLSAAIWVTSPWATGHQEPWYAESLYYVTSLIASGLVSCILIPKPLRAQYTGSGPVESPYLRESQAVSKLRFRISMSLDGFVAGPGQSVENPLGIGGMRLHQWAFPLAIWRAMHGLEGGEINESAQVVEASLANIGATGVRAYTLRA